MGKLTEKTLMHVSSFFAGISGFDLGLERAIAVMRSNGDDERSHTTLTCPNLCNIDILAIGLSILWLQCQI
jgi:hypothetical protein